ncbi:ribosomal large subunit pseudouridine synthase A [Nitzschia inconspicua]|uniref:Ribosomal large subunit pseudouridine synthase A n=1 Tax=Nitzschia inconspicua TaxID=303405 RepID=A0A9K3KZR8_9STRA|nr:ribosomal large subunit pseudouridine synthase A [Nitzschia inconspicua]
MTSVSAVDDPASVQFEPDNPCWGSPTRCGLKDLLSLLPKDRAILFDSAHYVVLNKPPDLRMDGPYAATVHKLLNYWYPSPSLIEQCTPVDGETNDEAFYKRLHEAVARVHQCNDLKDNFLRHCHQLDYATSGILLLAKTQLAASHVARLLEDRKVTKSYLAIVVGHLGDRLTNSKLPVWKGDLGVEQRTDEVMLRQCLERLEKRYRKSRSIANKQHNNHQKKDTKNNGKPHKTTFPGYQPAHSLFLKWKARMTKKCRTNNFVTSLPVNKKRKKEKADMLSEQEWERIWEPVDTLLSRSQFQGEAGWYQRLEWKDLNGEFSELKRALNQATDLYNDVLRNALLQSEQSVDATKDERMRNLPVLFRLEELSGISSSDTSNTTVCEFYVFCPLAVDPTSFSMVVPSEIVNEFPDIPSTTHPNKNPDEATYDFKPSLTKCTVLDQGTYTLSDDTVVPITKVELFPITGRRHQLRVHMALAGCPILGDMTYCKTSILTMDRRDMDCSSRMFLHAHSLALPSLVGEPEGEWQVKTPDPFPLENGTLNVSCDSL